MPLFASRVAMFSKHTHSRYRRVPSFLCCLELPFVIQTPKKGSNSVFLSSIFRCEIHAELRETGIWVYIYISFFLFFLFALRVGIAWNEFVFRSFGAWSVRIFEVSKIWITEASINMTIWICVLIGCMVVSQHSNSQMIREKWRERVRLMEET